MPSFQWFNRFRSRVRTQPIVNTRTAKWFTTRLRSELLEARDVPTLGLSIAPSSVFEGAGLNAATGTVTRDGDLSQPLTVSLSSNDTTEATVPGSVTIGANQAQASFPVNAVDDLILDGSQTVTVTASATVTGGGPVTLDPTYGVGGLAPTSLMQSIQFPHEAVALQSDGKLIAASEEGGGSWRLTRLNPNGTLDTFFGNNGIVSTPITSGSSNTTPVPHVVVIQSDGKILVGGKFAGGTGQAILVRYNPDGTLDGSFGANATSNLAGMGTAWVTDIAVRPGGQILLAMGENGSVLGRVVQLTSTGAYDTSFGNNNGYVLLNLQWNFGMSAEQVELMPDGSFLVAGSFQQYARVLRMNANGLTPVSSFGISGRADFNFSTSSVGSPQLAFDSQGRIVYGTYISRTTEDYAVGRLTPTGQLDNAFGTGGIAVLNSTVGEDIVTGMSIQPDDKIILGGVTIASGVYDSSLARFTSNGAPDPTFDGDGFYRQSLVNTYSADMIYDIALQPDGKLLGLTGWFTDLRVARFNIGSSSTQTATANITILDDEPTAQDLSFQTNEDVPLNETLVANDPDNDPLTYLVVSPPTSGAIIAMNPSTGAFTYRPNPNFHGPDSFTYKVNDGLADSNTATVRIAVASVNDAPTANGGSYSTDEDTSVSGQLSANDVDGDALSFSVVNRPLHGGVMLNTDGTFTYSPSLNYNGPDSFTFKVNDGTVDSNTATVDLRVNPVNDAPVAGGASFTTDEDTPLSAQVSANDVDGDRLSFSVVDRPVHGGLVLNLDGTFTYTPASNYNGPDSFTFKANDGAVDSNVARVDLRVNAVNDAPVADAKTASTDEDTPVTVVPTGTDVDGDTLSFAVVSPPSHGSVTQNADGSFTYSPTSNFNGPDSFTYRASDGTAVSPAAMVTITVRPVNDPPVADAKTASTDEDTSVSVVPTGTDVDGDTLSFAVVSPPSHGAVRQNADGSFTYTPISNYNGPDSFTYRASDGAAVSPAATVTITVRPVNDAPTVSPATFSLPENSGVNTFVGTVLGGDVDGDAITFSIIGGNTGGGFQINPANGQITVANSAALDYETTPVFNLTVQVRDPGGLTAQAAVRVNLTDVNENPGRVTIDIKPGDSSNSINSRSNGKIEVAILSTPSFDARTVDVNTLRFGRTGQEDSLSRNPAHGDVRYRIADVNGDGRLDLVAEFELERTGFRVGDARGYLTGLLLNGSAINGDDMVSVR